MIKGEFNHGFTQQSWNQAKSEAKYLLSQRAKLRGQMTYTELVQSFESIKLAPHDPRLCHFLDEVSAEEDEAGRGLLTVIVVHKQGDMQPGTGFFELAESRGRDASDVLACWIDEAKKVWAYWGKHR